MHTAGVGEGGLEGEKYDGFVVSSFGSIYYFCPGVRLVRWRTRTAGMDGNEEVKRKNGRHVCALVYIMYVCIGVEL